MLYLYATVYNNCRRIEKSIESLNKINTEKKFLIVDNYSNDGSYEILCKLKEKFNITIKREKSTRGRGRQIAMEMACNESTDSDLFMVFDLDTIYLMDFIELTEKYLKKLKRNEIFLNFLCYKKVNFAIPWEDLNGAEDFQRMAHLISEGYKLLIKKPEYDKYLFDNESTDYDDREKRYAKGIDYYKRRFSQVTDIMRSLGICNINNLKQYLKDVGVRKRFYPYSLFIFSLMKIRKKKIYSYNNEINLFYVRKNAEVINLDFIRK